MLPKLTKSRNINFAKLPKLRRTLSDWAFNMLPVYSNVWKPERIQNVTLSYVDIVEIPEQQINLDEYFNLKFSFPEDLGIAGSMEGHIAFPEEKGYKNVIFRQIPSQSGNVIFQFFWTASRQLDTNSTDEIAKQELDSLHREIIKSFEASFTEKCKNLFIRLVLKLQTRQFSEIGLAYFCCFVL